MDQQVKDLLQTLKTGKSVEVNYAQENWFDLAQKIATEFIDKPLYERGTGAELPPNTTLKEGERGTVVPALGIKTVKGFLSPEMMERNPIALIRDEYLVEWLQENNIQFVLFKPEDYNATSLFKEIA